MLRPKQLLVSILFFVLSVTLQAQKRLVKEWISPSFSHIAIESDAISMITLRSHQLDYISIYIRVDGETVENSIITTSTTETQLTIGTDFTPYFQPFNDKLAAHKVLAIEMIIMVPERMQIQIRSSLASVEGNGSFAYLKTELEMGWVRLEYFKGNATLHSKWGLIQVKARKNVTGRARSTYGKVTNLLSTKRKVQIDAVSIHGNIELLQTKK